MELADLVKWAIPDVEECRRAADDIRKGHPDSSDEDLAGLAISRAKKIAAVGGAVAGAVANPVAMFPAAGADMANCLRAEGKMAGVIAALLDPDSLSDRDHFEADVIAVLFVSSASQALKEAGVNAGKHLTKAAIRKFISKDVLKTIVKFAAKYLGIKLTQRAIITKTIPLVGGAIGAGWNWAEVRAVGKRAVAYHTGSGLE